MKRFGLGSMNFNNFITDHGIEPRTEGMEPNRRGRTAVQPDRRYPLQHY